MIAATIDSAEIESLIFTVLSRYAPIKKKDVTTIVSQLKPYYLEKGDVLVNEWDISAPWFLITSGIIRKFYIDSLGVEKNVDFISEKGYLTGLLSTGQGLPQKKIGYSLQALTACDVLMLTEESQKMIMNETTFPWQEIERLYFREKVIQLEKQLMSIQFESALERYENFIKEYSEIHDQLPLNQIASYLGITPVSLSRIRNQR
ncbi:MAG: hypothetical protein PQJ58_08260 [Spirochaetales bacterium]|nr:hypothetical protein [Spirochaetales bacterium]